MFKVSQTDADHLFSFQRSFVKDIKLRMVGPFWSITDINVLNTGYLSYPLMAQDCECF